MSPHKGSYKGKAAAVPKRIRGTKAGHDAAKRQDWKAGRGKSTKKGQ